MPNPNKFPSFSTIDVATFSQALDNKLQENLKRINALLQFSAPYSWDNLIRPLEDIEDDLERFWSPLSHLHSVANSPALRACYKACLPLLAAYEAAIGQNHALYEAVTSLDTRELNPTQQKIVSDILRDFRLSGVSLPAEKKNRLEIIQTRLSELSNLFENHVLDAEQDYILTVTDSSRLAGLPDYVIENAHILAKERGLEGWAFNLEFPRYNAVITYAEDRNLRAEIYTAYVTRASDQGPAAGKFDNSAIMNEMLALRHEQAGLLGFANYAELSLATKMANSVGEVRDFLDDLSKRAYPQARAEFNALQAFARSEFKLQDLAPWDIAFLSERKRQTAYHVSQEEVRAYFPVQKVMQGLFTIISTLYGLTVEEVKDIDVWHPDVTCYQLVGRQDQVVGYIYVDLFARKNKRNGAWMDSLQSRRVIDGKTQLPIAVLSCNFTKPPADIPATLLHNEVTTLFHECGHCLHHVLTQVDYISVSGIHGVEWDAVELPSQFFENWCWEQSALELLTEHVKTGKTIPSEMIDNMLAAKNFNAGLYMVRQLEFSLFDFRIHQEYDASNSHGIADILADVRKHLVVAPIAPFNRQQHSFSHIFAGGYAAGYYSYKWAEVLSSDAFARFEEEGIFNPKTGSDFLHAILEVGGSQKAAEAYRNFRGRDATVDAFLRHNGIQA